MGDIYLAPCADKQENATFAREQASACVPIMTILDMYLVRRLQQTQMEEPFTMTERARQKTHPAVLAQAGQHAHHVQNVVDEDMKARHTNMRRGQLQVGVNHTITLLAHHAHTAITKQVITIIRAQNATEQDIIDKNKLQIAEPKRLKVNV